MKREKPNFLPAVITLCGVAALVIIGSLYAFRDEPDLTQGEADVTEYRVSSKVPGRILRFMVSEGDYVHAGDTLAILEAPDLQAKLSQAQAAEAAAAAQSRKAAYEMWQKARAASQLAQKSYDRVKRLYDQGVTTAQKLDEVTAQRDAALATEQAAKAQHDMAVNGAEREDKDAAAALVSRAKGAVSEVTSYVAETVLTASADEVTDIFPQVGELVGTGAPVMNVALMHDMWVTFTVREDRLQQFKMHGTVHAVSPALGNKRCQLTVYYMKDRGSYATWKATKATGQWDRKTFEVKARPVQKVEGLRPGMSVLVEE